MKAAAGSGAVMTTTSSNGLLIQGNGSSPLQAASFLQVLGTTTYYNFADTISSGTRTISFTVTDSAGNQTTSQTIVRLVAAGSYISCLASPLNVDVAFILDASSSSSFWGNIRQYLSSTISLLPVTAHTIRFD